MARYMIRQDRRRRISPDTHVIITHMYNLELKGISYGDHDLIRGSYRYSWGRTQDYLLRHVYKYGLPMHYYVEQLEQDYVVFKGISEYKPSYYINELVDAGIIERKYRDSLLIVIAEDFEYYTAEGRMMAHLSDKVLFHLHKTMGIDFNKIKILDECFTDNYIDHVDNFRFRFKPMTKFDKTRLRQYYTKYKVF